MGNTWKNKFIRPFKRRNKAIYITSLLVFMVAIGLTFYQSTKKTVALTIDGEEKTVSTHAKTVQDLLNDLNITVAEHDYLQPEADTELSEELEITWMPASQVTLTIDGEPLEIWTTTKTVGEFLEEQKIVLNETDKLSHEMDSALEASMAISLERSFSLTLSDGGTSKEVWSTSTTVADFLEQQGVTLNELDRVEPALETTISANDVVNVVRVEKVTDVVEEPVSFAVVSQKDNTLQQGQEKVLTEGKEGLVSNEYEVIKENGTEVSRTLVSQTVVQQKQDKVVAVGTKAVQVASRGQSSSAPSGGTELTVESTAYTAYCTGCSGTTATGFDLRSNPNAKVIAVDPSVIPLGTKVWVEGYGYAVAADTGGAIKGNKIDVFFSNKSQAYQWGRKKVKIRIVN
ncbi:MAG: ubiquitin-like domain-containing protein [Bacillus sp. (in: firmicutes)]